MFDIKKIIGNIDINDIQKYSHKEINLSDFYYNLLKYASDMFEDELILDIGTHYGHSALALGLNRKNHVKTYDVVSLLRNEECENIKKDFNIEFNILKAQDIPLEFYKESKIIFLDIIHNGVEEKEVLDIILKSGFEGILICDDICFNDEMKKFYEEIKLYKIWMKDLRTSGLGIILFNIKYADFFQ